MAFVIPRIQYKNIETIGDTTNGDDDITNIFDTSEVEVGMFVRGTGIPTGATVLSKTSSSVKLNSPKVASATNAAIDLAFGFEILFDYPPIEPTGESLETKATVNESLSGIQQVAVGYVEAKRDLKFSFLSPAIYALMNTFLSTWAVLGEDFRYFEDQSSSSYTTYELDNLKVQPKKIAPRSTTTYVWEIPLKFRRVL